MTIEKRREYKDYEEYVSHQLDKTLTPKLRNTWLRKFDGKVKKFIARFRHLEEHGIIKDGIKALCLGARMGEEVVAFKKLGADAIGIDLAPNLPLVLKGDFNNLEFDNDSFDLVYTNSFDHAWDTEKIFDGIHRVLKPGGLFVMDVFPGEGNYARCEVIFIESDKDIEKKLCEDRKQFELVKDVSRQKLPNLQRRHKEVQLVFRKI